MFHASFLAAGVAGSPWLVATSIFVKVKVKSLSGVRLCDPIDCRLPGSSVHGISQARILEWGAISVFMRHPQFYIPVSSFPLLPLRRTLVNVTYSKSRTVSKPLTWLCLQRPYYIQIRSQLKFMVGMPFGVTLFNPLQTHLLLVGGRGLWAFLVFSFLTS